jgi:lysozyme family protein
MANKNFDISYKEILKHLPPYKNNEGNEDLVENFGVYKKDYESYAGASFSRDEYYNLTSEDVKEYYEETFWNKCMCNDLPSGIDYLIFAHAVFTDCQSSIIKLQKILNLDETGTMDISVVDSIHPSDGVIKTDIALKFIESIKASHEPVVMITIKNAAMFLI